MPVFIYATLLVFVSQMAFDIYYPSMPHLTTVFQVTPDAVQYSVAAFVFGTAISRLIFGACIDAWGVRSLLPSLLIFFAVSTVGCMWANNIHLFVACRFAQGSAAGGIFLAAIFLITHEYDRQRFAKYFSYLSAAWSLGLTLAPVIGGYIHNYLGWRYSFALIVLATLALFALQYAISISPFKKQILHIGETMRSYQQMLTCYPFFFLMIQMAICFSIIITYNTVGPFLFQRGLHFTVVQYAWITIPVAASYLCGTMLNSRLVDHVPVRQIVRVSQIVWVGGAVVMTMTAFALPMSVMLILVPMMLFFLLDGLMYPNVMSLAVVLFPNAVGKATALMTISSYFLGGLAALAATLLSYTHLRDVSLFFLVLSMAGLLCHYLIWRSKLLQALTATK